jgi:hypothetical protein
MVSYTYQEIADLPKCNCCNKPHIDATILEKCTPGLLFIIKSELEKAIQNCGIFGSPAPTCDVEAQEQYCKQVQEMISIKDLVIKELKKRGVPVRGGMN